MSERGVIIIHNTQVFGKNYSIHKLWKEMADRYPSYEFKLGNGLGIIAVGNQCPSVLTDFLEACRNDATVPDAFQLAGSALFNKYEIRRLQKEITHQKEEIILLHNKLEKYKLKLSYIAQPWVFLFRKMLQVFGKIFSGAYWKKKLNKRNEKHLKVYSYVSPDIENIRTQIHNLAYKPFISVIMPVYNTDPKWLCKAIESVRDQLYPNWELCIVDDHSTNTETISFLREISDPKIKIEFSDTNRHISYCSNQALKLATGDYIALLDHDDEYTPDALYEIVKTINETGAKFIYSDEDKIDFQGLFIYPHFKKSYTIDTLPSCNYICHLAVIKKDLVEKVGGFTIGLEGAQDHDLFLRISEITNEIAHVPKVLYHWRQLEGSTSVSFSYKNYAWEAGRQAIENALIRRKIPCQVEIGMHPGIFTVVLP
jgi:hypothetical protein